MSADNPRIERLEREELARLVEARPAAIEDPPDWLQNGWYETRGRIPTPEQQASLDYQREAYVHRELVQELEARFARAPAPARMVKGGRG